MVTTCQRDSISNLFLRQTMIRVLLEPWTIWDSDLSFCEYLPTLTCTHLWRTVYCIVISLRSYPNRTPLLLPANSFLSGLRLNPGGDCNRLRWTTPIVCGLIVLNGVLGFGCIPWLLCSSSVSNYKLRVIAMSVCLSVVQLYLVQRSVETTHYTVNGHCSCRPANIRFFRPGIFKWLKCTECFHY
jgi:hypothetical protein